MKNKLQNNSTIPLKNFIFLSLVVFSCLSHLTFTQYNFVNSTTIIIGIVFICAIVFIKCISKNDVFAFIMIIYVGSHFANFMPGAGGLFTIVAFLIYIFFFPQINRNFNFTKIGDKYFLFVWILILSNVLGWLIKSPVSLSQLGMGIITFFS